MNKFDNTEIAFKSKSNKDLNRAYWLFKIIGNPKVVSFGKWATTIALKLHLPINGIIKKTIFKQFCGGETIESCAKTTQELYEYGIGTILDYSVEGKTDESDFEQTTDEIIATIETAKGNKAIPFAVFKVTGIANFFLLEKANDLGNILSTAEKINFQGIESRIEKICLAASTNNIPLFIDAEESWIQDTIDRLATSMMTKYNTEKAIIFNTIQMYRHDRLDFLNTAVLNARQHGYHYGVKLVRGAYMEKERNRAQHKNYPSPIQLDKTACDNDYNKALSFIIENIDVMAVCAGTHNEESSLLLTELLEVNRISKNDGRIYFAQLLGMSDHITYNLASQTFNTAKYVPYGPIREVLPYLLRRADENTSVAGQTGRELSLLSQEKSRRKKQIN